MNLGSPSDLFELYAHILHHMIEIINQVNELNDKESKLNTGIVSRRVTNFTFILLVHNFQFS